MLLAAALLAPIAAVAIALVTINACARSRRAITAAPHEARHTEGPFR